MLDQYNQRAKAFLEDKHRRQQPTGTGARQLGCSTTSTTQIGPRERDLSLETQAALANPIICSRSSCGTFTLLAEQIEAKLKRKMRPEIASSGSKISKQTMKGFANCRRARAAANNAFYIDSQMASSTAKSRNRILASEKREKTSAHFLLFLTLFFTLGLQVVLGETPTSQRPAHQGHQITSQQHQNHYVQSNYRRQSKLLNSRGDLLENFQQLDGLHHPSGAPSRHGGQFAELPAGRLFRGRSPLLSNDILGHRRRQSSASGPRAAHKRARLDEHRAARSRPKVFLNRNLWTLVPPASSLASERDQWAADSMMEQLDAELMDELDEEEEEEEVDGEDEGGENEIENEIDGDEGEEEEDDEIEDESGEKFREKGKEQENLKDNDEEEEEDEEEEQNEVSSRRKSFKIPKPIPGSKSAFLATQAQKSHYASSKGHSARTERRGGPPNDGAKLKQLAARNQVPQELDGLFTSSELANQRRHHQKHQSKLKQHKQQQQQRQLPIVVSISDNSFVSASPVVAAPSSNPQQQQQQQQQRRRPIGDKKMDNDDEENEDGAFARRRHFYDSTTVSTTATTTSGSASDASTAKLGRQLDARLMYSSGGGDFNYSYPVASNYAAGSRAVSSGSEPSLGQQVGAQQRRRAKQQHQQRNSLHTRRRHRPESSEMAPGESAADSGNFYSSFTNNFKNEQTDATPTPTTTTIATELAASKSVAAETNSAPTTRVDKQLLDSFRVQSDPLSASAGDQFLSQQKQNAHLSAPSVLLMPTSEEPSSSPSERLEVFSLAGIQRAPLESASAPSHYSNMIRSPNNELPSEQHLLATSGRPAASRHWHGPKWHKASIRTGQEVSANTSQPFAPNSPTSISPN